jgi:predicted membrane protein (TIGR00267 family)
MTPYTLAFLGILSTQMALYVAVILILVLLFILGAFLGRISKANFIFGGLRMLLVGAVTAVILLLVGGLPH